jgi:hypothetical protein
MSTLASWNSSGSRVVGLSGQPKWAEIRRGLRFVLVGHLVLFALAACGVVFRLDDWGWLRLPDLIVPEPEDTEMLRWLGVTGFVIGGLLTLIGQWLCLRSAPQEDGGKELVFTSILAAVIVLPLACAAPLADAVWNGRALDGLLYALRLRAFPSVTSVLLGTFFGLVLVNLLSFSQFVRVVAIRFDKGLLARLVGSFFVYVCLLLGGSAGVFLVLRQLHSAPVVIAGVAAGWGLCLLWHSLLVVGTLRVVARALRRAPFPGSRKDSGTKKPYSGTYQHFKSSADIR